MALPDPAIHRGTVLETMAKPGPAMTKSMLPRLNKIVIEPDANVRNRASREKGKHARR